MYMRIIYPDGTERHTCHAPAPQIIRVFRKLQQTRGKLFDLQTKLFVFSSATDRAKIIPCGGGGYDVVYIDDYRIPRHRHYFHFARAVKGLGKLAAKIQTQTDAKKEGVKTC